MLGSGFGTYIVNIIYPSNFPARSALLHSKTSINLSNHSDFSATEWSVIGPWVSGHIFFANDGEFLSDFFWEGETLVLHICKTILVLPSIFVLLHSCNLFRLIIRKT